MYVPGGSGVARAFPSLGPKFGGNMDLQSTLMQEEHKEYQHIYDNY